MTLQNAMSFWSQWSESKQRPTDEKKLVFCIFRTEECQNTMCGIDGKIVVWLSKLFIIILYFFLSFTFALIKGLLIPNAKKVVFSVNISVMSLYFFLLIAI